MYMYYLPATQLMASQAQTYRNAMREYFMFDIKLAFVNARTSASCHCGFCK